jgi:AcrR family transcriptional regulator
LTSTAEWKARPDGPDYDAVRARLVDAAEELVRVGGVNALRLDSVAEAAHLHRSSVYRYFRSKEELLTAVVTQASQRVRRKVARQLGRSATPERVLAEGLAMALAELVADPVHRALADPSATEAMAKVGAKALTGGLRPVVDPVFEQAAAEGLLREGVSTEDASRWLQVVARGLLRSPDLLGNREQVTALLDLMLIPALFEQ